MTSIQDLIDLMIENPVWIFVVLTFLWFKMNGQERI